MTDRDIEKEAVDMGTACYVAWILFVAVLLYTLLLLIQMWLL